MSGIYDGATGSATLTYNGVPCGARGGPQTSNASSIVPWIATQAGAKADEDMRFAAFDGNDRLSKVLHNKTENIPLSSFGPNDNAYVWKGGVSLSADTTLNSLSIVNDATSKQLGESRTLALTSGGLILGDVSSLAGTLVLGTTSTACVLNKELPIRIYANATLSLPNAESATGNIVKFDGAAGWFGKVEVPAGVNAKCRKAYWRDYPETEEWQSIPRGVYTGDAATALATGATYDPDRFAGSGTVTILKDDTTFPLIIKLR